MNRRILLIDPDPTFRTTLTITVQKYRIDVLHEPDADEAIAQTADDPPALVIIGVDEPEKAGFKSFQRLKKTALAKVPIVLVTSTVAPESFAKHKSLKTHADAYLDKRGLSKDLLAKTIDELIGLADPDVAADDDLDIPVEVDDINVGDGPVIDDEAPPESMEHENFETKTIMGAPERHIDAAVADDVDDAFAGLMGGELGGDEAPPPAPPAPVRRHDDAEFDELPSTRADLAATQRALHADGTAAPAADLEATTMASAYEDPVPAPIHDGGRSDDENDFVDEAVPAYGDDVLMSRDMIPIGDLGAEADAEQGAAVEQAAEPAPAEAARPAILESSPAIQLAEEDVELLSEGDLVEDQADDSGGIPEPVPHPRSADDAAEAAAARESQPVRRPSQTSSPSIDLGLEKIAADAQQEQQSGGFPRVDADRDQSGVYDRRALRKIGELERQIAQLKTELERSRAVADAAAKGGGREQTFLNLREKMMAADNELKKARADLQSREAELGEVGERLRAAEDARRNLDGKRAELEQQLAAESAKARQLATQQQDLQATVGELEAQLASQAESLSSLEKARAQLEGELASERALRASSASDAERQLRVEREELVARHQGELAALRQELVAKHEAELERLREELAHQQSAQIAAATEATRAEARREAEDAIAQLEQQREQDLAALRTEHQGALARVTAELEAQLADARSSLATAQAAHEQALAEQAGAHATELANQANQHAAAMAARERELTAARQDDAIAHTAALAELKAEIDKLVAKHGDELAGAKRELEELAALQERHKSEIVAEQRAAQERLAAEHAAELERVQADKQRAIEDIGRAAAEHKAATERAAEQHREELASQREAAERELAELRQVLVAAKRQLEDTVAKHQAERAEIEKQHAHALSEQVAQHERAMAVANGEIVKVKAVADSEHNRAMAAAKAEWERERKELEASYRAQLEEVTTERDQLERGLSAARDTIKRSEGELATAVQTIADRNAELRSASAAIAERDQRIGDLRKELEAIEQENASYQDQVLRAYQKIKSDEAMVARAKKAMAIALTALDEPSPPKPEPT